MTELEKLRELCQYVIDIDNANIPVQLKYELMLYPRHKLTNAVSLHSIYGWDSDWEDVETEVQEFANVVRKLKDDLNRIGDAAWVA